MIQVHPWFSRLSLALSGLLLAGSLSCHPSGGLNLTAQERSWLTAHPVIHWAPDLEYPPIEWMEPNGAVKGLAPDYLAVIGERLGVRFEPVRASDWQGALAMLQAGQVDMVSNITNLPERQGQFLFTGPYLDVPSVLLSRADDRVRGLDDLNNKRMALERGYIIQGMLKKSHPLIQIREVANTEEALSQLALGAVDGTIADLTQASWTIENRQLTGIRMVCPLPQFPSQFCMGVRKDAPLLRDILDKSLKGLTSAEHQELRRRWISLQVRGWHGSPAFWGSLVGALGLAAFGLILGWNHALRKRVKARTQELERSAASLATLNEELVQAITEVKTLRGFIPICMSCKKIRNDGGYWDQLEAYLAAHSEARFSHGYCPDCLPAAEEKMRRDLGMPDK